MSHPLEDSAEEKHVPKNEFPPFPQIISTKALLIFDEIFSDKIFLYALPMPCFVISLNLSLATNIRTVTFTAVTYCVLQGSSRFQG